MQVCRTLNHALSTLQLCIQREHDCLKLGNAYTIYKWLLGLLLDRPLSSPVCESIAPDSFGPEQHICRNRACRFVKTLLLHRPQG